MDASGQRHEPTTAGEPRARRRGYVRHRPERTVLYSIIERHADAFFAYLREHGAGLPAFVREEFEATLRCGRLEEGFVRVKCERCRHEHLVAFSCKRRGFCPSCASRRMVETATMLVEEVLPAVPIRQWVVTFPVPLRLVFASRPDLLTRVLGVVVRALSSATIRRAGRRRGQGAQTGVVTFIQRFGSALNLEKQSQYPRCTSH
jgi:ribosomal protein S27E